MQTLTFLFTDIEGSTALLGRVGESVTPRSWPAARLGAEQADRACVTGLALSFDEALDQALGRVPAAGPPARR